MAPKTRAAAAKARGKPKAASRDRSRTPAPGPRPERGSPVKARCQNAEPTWIDTYRAAVEALRPGGLTGVMPCRDAEKAQISKHLRQFVLNGGSQTVLYVSGMPGTGKTASLFDILGKMQKEQARNPKLRFNVVSVNAMCLGSPAAAYRAILKQLPNAPKCSAAASAQELKSFFTNRKPTDPVVLVLIDEVDQLVTANQAVLYKVFDLLCEPCARLAMVAISNTVDLPERLLPRVTSRFRVARVEGYAPYTRDQIHTILLERLRAKNAARAFEDTALKLSSARVAAGSGDLRKAMQVCCRAVELRSTFSGALGEVRREHLQKAEQELLHASPVSKHVAGLGVAPRRFLLAVVLELRRSEGADAVSLRKVTRRYEKLCSAEEQDGAEEAWISEARFDASFLLEKLRHLSLLQDAGAEDEDAGRFIRVGLDAEDLKAALLSVEKNEGFRDLLEDSIAAEE